MPYKSLLLHVEAIDIARARLRAAAVLARMFDARLIGVGARAFNPMPDPTGLSVEELKQEIEEDLANAERLFKTDVAALGIASHIWRAEVDFPTQALLKHACEADLILAEPNLEAKAHETRAGTAELIASSGLPVLAVPAGSQLDFTKVVIGWKNTREARRALWDALPLLTRAQMVRLVHFSSELAPEILDVVVRLRLHDVTVEGETRQRTEASVAADLIAAAKEMQAGLIVVGGYGHSRLRERIMGGVTSGLLAHSLRPVLFSH